MNDLDEFRNDTPDGWWWRRSDCFVVSAHKIRSRRWAVLARYHNGVYYGGVVLADDTSFERDYAWGSLEKTTAYYMRVIAEHHSDRLSQEE